MSWPPYLMKLRINKFGLWLPLFLIWPVVLVCVLAVFLILLPFAILAFIFTWQLGWWRPLVLSIPGIYSVLCNLRGMTVEVEGRDGHIGVEFK
jgi:hypothetical protein